MKGSIWQLQLIPRRNGLYRRVRRENLINHRAPKEIFRAQFSSDASYNWFLIRVVFVFIASFAASYSLGLFFQRLSAFISGKKILHQSRDKFWPIIQAIMICPLYFHQTGFGKQFHCMF